METCTNCGHAINPKKTIIHFDDKTCEQIHKLHLDLSRLCNALEFLPNDFPDAILHIARALAREGDSGGAAGAIKR